MKNRKAELGAVLLIAAAGLVALLGATALAVDIGYFFLVKNQLQNTADAAALAGAKGLIVEPQNYRDDGPAKQWAIEYAGKNKADTQPVILRPDEITFCNVDRNGTLIDCSANPFGDRNVVHVTITRDVRTLFGSIFSVSQVSVGVEAAAAVVSVCGGTRAPSGGWRPFAIPDQFANRNSGTRVRTRDFGQPFVARELGSCDPPCNADLSCNVDLTQDWYMSPYDGSLAGMNLSLEGDFGQVTGYITMRDVIDLFWEPITLKVGSPSASIAPGQFYPITFPPNVRSGGGAAEYRDNIVYGWEGQLQVGDMLYLEPGNMIGPTRQGVRDLIAQDPNASLALTNGVVKIENSAYPEGQSPRLVPIAMFDPSQPPGPGRDFVQVTNIGGFFVRQQFGDDICGTYVPIQLFGGSPGNCGGGGGRLGVTVQLVQ
ncbi:MAG: Tad domain-containing protein [Acidobacteria bacterium]|nr:Tad domain-containing protein [Acidobacteriota bacterium]